MCRFPCQPPCDGGTGDCLWLARPARRLCSCVVYAGLLHCSHSRGSPNGVDRRKQRTSLPSDSRIVCSVDSTQSESPRGQSLLMNYGVLLMTPQAEFPTSTSWRTAFRDEWFRLADSRSDVGDIENWAIELYPTHWRRHPVRVAREEWHESASESCGRNQFPSSLAKRDFRSRLAVWMSFVVTEASALFTTLRSSLAERATKRKRLGVCDPR